MSGAFSQAPTTLSGGESPAGEPPGGTDGLTRTIALAIILLSLAAGAYHSTQAYANPDELEHLHATWLWARGVQPFTQFFEVHPPLYWIVLRPLVNSVGDENLMTLMIRGRLFSWLIAALTVAALWWLFAALFGRKAAWWGAAFFAAYCAMSDHAVHIRPDMASVLLAVWGSTLAINGFGVGRYSRGVSPWRALAGGALLAGGVCMLTKTVFWALAVSAALGGLAVWDARQRRGFARLAALGMLAVGAAVPAGLQLAWIFLANDWARFWYCNVQANRHWTGSALVSGDAFNLLWREAFSWPLVSAPLAALGLGYFIASGGPEAGMRKLLACLILACGVALVLLGNGPWGQYHIPLLAPLAGLAGVGAAVALDRCSVRERTAAAAAMLAAALFLVWVMAVCPGDRSRWRLREKIDPLQHVLDARQPGDTFIAVQHWNPVFMMDDDPGLFMNPVVFNDPQNLEQLVDEIEKRRPRWVVGYGSIIWTAGENRTVPAPRQLLNSYRNVGLTDLVLERQWGARPPAQPADEPLR